MINNYRNINKKDKVNFHNYKKQKRAKQKIRRIMIIL